MELRQTGPPVRLVAVTIHVPSYLVKVMIDRLRPVRLVECSNVRTSTNKQAKNTGEPNP